jgi:GNAT superfamily N-acetyltransferase
MDVTYAIEDALSADEFTDVLHRSGLAARRPVDDGARIAKMVRNANLTVCARDDAGRLIGVSRCITDFAYCCYCSDLAVDEAWQGRGIGRELLRLSREAVGPETSFLLMSAPAAMSYYPKIGMEKLDNCFGFPRTPSDEKDNQGK